MSQLYFPIGNYSWVLSFIPTRLFMVPQEEFKAIFQEKPVMNGEMMTFDEDVLFFLRNDKDEYAGLYRIDKGVVSEVDIDSVVFLNHMNFDSITFIE